mgnify:CR=1 FL=1
MCDFNVDDLCMHYQKTKKQERENFVRRKFKKIIIFKSKKYKMELLCILCFIYHTDF